MTIQQTQLGDTLYHWMLRWLPNWFRVSSWLQPKKRQSPKTCRNVFPLWYIYIDRWCFPIFSACPSVLFFRFAIILIIGNQNQTFGALSYNFSLWCGLRVAFETMWLKTPSLSLILGQGGENLRVADLVKATRFVTRPTKLGQLPGYPQIHQPSTGSIFWYG